MLDLMTKDTEGADERRDKRERIRLVIDTEEVVRRAVRLRALRTGQDNSDVVNGILREALALEIEEASQFPHATGKKPGRKPKKGGGE